MAPFDIIDESKDGKTIRFRILGVDNTIANGMRRVLLSDIPTAAINFRPHATSNPDVVFEKNTCSLHNEFIGQRLSLVPLCFDLQELDTFVSSDYTFVINEKNDGKDSVDVTTAHFKILDAGGKPMTRDFVSRIFPADPITKDRILITRLKPNHFDETKGEELHLTARAAIGTAKAWAGHSAVSKSVFYNVVDDAKAAKALAEKLGGVKKTYAEKGYGEVEPGRLAEVEHNFNCLDRYRCFKTDEHGDPNEFEFEIESVCGLSCRQLVRKALTVLGNKLQPIANGNMEVKAEQVGKTAFSLAFSPCNHTEGSMLQAHIFDNLARPKKVVGYVGYNVPHPLEETMVLKLTFLEDGRKVDDAVQFVRDQAGELQQTLRTLRDAWEALKK
jgi:DNA-directed RNA polymerase subunit L